MPGEMNQRTEEIWDYQVALRKQREGGNFPPGGMPQIRGVGYYSAEARRSEEEDFYGRLSDGLRRCQTEKRPGLSAKENYSMPDDAFGLLKAGSGLYEFNNFLRG